MFVWDGPDQLRSASSSSSIKKLSEEGFDGRSVSSDGDSLSVLFDVQKLAACCSRLSEVWLGSGVSPRNVVEGNGAIVAAFSLLKLDRGVLRLLIFAL